MRISKFPALICWPCLIITLLTGCKEQEHQIRDCEDSISRALEEKRAAEVQAKEYDRELAQLRKANREKLAVRNEFESKSAKSEASEKLATQFRTELEASLNRYAKDISAYRDKYLTP